MPSCASTVEDAYRDYDLSARFRLRFEIRKQFSGRRKFAEHWDIVIWDCASEALTQLKVVPICSQVHAYASEVLGAKSPDL
jgi:hypothetical protein